jgi:hypothetical protein
MNYELLGISTHHHFSYSLTDKLINKKNIIKLCLFSVIE